MNKKAKCFTLDEEVIKEGEKRAKKEKRSFSFIVNEILRKVFKIK